ncbi:MAG: hypothetical protein GVY09_03095 [Gammaproteobacteria bacterium]|nr:hypothetical protein [Gammaproteobacteria bacterium]
MYREDQVPEDDAHLQERVRKASAYFGSRLDAQLRPWLDAFGFETDNKALRKSLGQAVEELRKALAIKTACIESCREGFATSAYLDAVSKARIDLDARPPQAGTRPDAGKVTGGDDLLAALQAWRKRKGEAEARDGSTQHHTLTRAVLRRIAEARPNSRKALKTIHGIGKRSVERYGAEILAIVAEHRQPVASDAEAAARPAKTRNPTETAPETDTRLTSYRLHREGLSIQEIAERRSLKPTTIEGHLADFIRAGKLAVTDVIGDEKLARMSAVLTETGTDTLGPAKQALGDDCSYGELKMVQAHLARK